MKFLLLAFIGVSSFAWGYEFGEEVTDAVRKQVTTDLALLETFTGDTASAFHKEIFGEVGGKNYLEWFNKRVTRIGMHTCGAGGNSKPVACVIPMLGASKIWLTKFYVEANDPMMSKMATLFHEARHAENEHGNWPHAKCPVPFKNAKGEDIVSYLTGAKLEGRPACDSTPFGSYGTELIMLKNINRNCTSCTEKVRMDAGIYADFSLERFPDKDAHASLVEDLYSAE